MTRWTDRTLAALDQPARKLALNEALFTEIAPRYDLITRLLSFGRDGAWKRALVAALPAGDAPECVDIACGTGDLTALVAGRYPQGAVLGLDLTESMLTIARSRRSQSRVTYVRGDMASLPVPDESVDIVTGGYALRNAPQLDGALREVWRVLRPGGVAAFLDFSKPAWGPAQRVELALLRAWGGLWGLLLHGDPGVYAYIAHSLARFPDRVALGGLVQAQGFQIQHERRFLGGIVKLVVMEKPGGDGNAGVRCQGSGRTTESVHHKVRPETRHLKPFTFPDFSRRANGPELMDAADCDEVLLLRTLAQFRWINRIVGGYRALLTRTVLRDMQGEPQREYHLVDLGAGGCDIPAWLLGRSRQLGLRLRVTALDLDPRTAAWARARYGNLPGLKIVCAGADALAECAPVDYVFANHFLHHLPDDAIRALLAQVHAVARRGYVIEDIRRSVGAYVGATLLTGVCFRRSFAYADGRLSVRRAFTRGELEQLIPQGARVVGGFPFRLAVVFERRKGT